MQQSAILTVEPKATPDPGAPAGITTDPPKLLPP